MDEATAVLVIILAMILAASFILIPLGYLLAWVFRKPLDAYRERLLRQLREEMEDKFIDLDYSRNGHRRVSKKD